jgi:hypothetical protein
LQLRLLNITCCCCCCCCLPWMLQRWVSGFEAMRFWSHNSAGKTPLRRQQPSPVRLLAATQRLMRAHCAAAAAAAGEGAAGPTWGQLDVQRLIARDPGVLLVRTMGCV